MASALDIRSTADDAADVFGGDIKGKGIIITGVSLGSLGFESALSIAKKSPALLVLTGRSPNKLQAVEAEIKKTVPDANIRLLDMDLSSLKSVQAAAEEVKSYEEPINVLINSAGIMAAPYSTTVDGFESQFGVNHVGPFFFTQSIMPKLLESPGAVVVVVSSLACNIIDIQHQDPGFDGGKAYNNWAAYAQSKTANALFAVGLSNRYDPSVLRAYSLQPGMVWSNIFQNIRGEDNALHAEEKKMFVDMGSMDEDGNRLDGGQLPWKSLQEGGATSITAAFNKNLPSGSYLMDNQVIPDGILAPYVLDPQNAEKLWDMTVKMLGSKGYTV